jgi:GalNAc-alpha-(1->4)-GalNAc-alpha-(1->3)-diNAcBac-PP-undecaprenol alpha-1,4-N-acetyl-D-galactosaminyltransferase
MKKICLVIPSLQAGGMERVMSELANYFCTKSGIAVHLIILAKSEIFFDLSPQIIVHMPAFYFNQKFRLFFIIKTLFFLRNLFLAIRPDAVLSFGEMYNSFVLLASIHLKTRVFVSDRSKPDKPWGRFHELLRKKLYPLAHGIIAQTSYSKDYLKKLTAHQNIKVIPNPVKIIESKLNEKQNIILNVGRLIPSKRIDIIIDIFSKLNCDNWRLWIVGDGPQEKILKNQTARLGMENKVVFWGRQKNVENFYSKAKLFAFTSISEGFPNALMEAMACKSACIAFDCVTGPSDLIKDGVNGFLVPILNIQEYTEKLETLTKRPELIEMFSERAFLTVQELKIDSIGDQYLNFLLS